MSVADNKRARDAGAPLIRAATLASGSGWKVNEYTCLAGPGDGIAEERHDIVTVAAVVEGSFVYHGDSGRHLMHPGTLLAGNHGCCYSCGHDHGTGDRCIALHVDYELFSEIAATSAGSSKFRFPVAMLPSGNGFAPFLATLSAFDPKLSRASSAAPNSKLSNDEVITENLGNLLAIASGTTPARVGGTAHDERRISRVLRFIEDHLNEDLTLAPLATVAAMSKFHFIRTFRKVTGTTPHNYIQTRRLVRAAAAVRSSPAPISEIAFDTGLPDLSTFNRQFRSVFKASPRNYRRGK